MSNAIFNNADIFSVTDADLEHLCKQAQAASNGRYRICLHQSQSDLIQEMLIAMAAHSKLQPHRRKGTKRTYAIICGKLRLVLFDNIGNLVKTIDMSLKETRFVRLSCDYYILPIPIETPLVLHEIAEGPFLAEDDYASWYQDTNYDQYLTGTK
ncbi:WbuC family cupin fold metalloprotein [Pseudoalteromonas sp. T1lg23B]|uniref:WbuC family cupin fold metalloprotein n=1 Tax=Pseudoalteromonas sp. T1lg23B TaxID=2077097 RepID=UPI000CF708F3|nr:WbuC family cupin fold metalloprotein [Pseudoalteromonas sp. T1lg23B]